MATYFSLRDGLLTDTSTYGLSLSSIEKTTNTTGYMLLTSDSWSTVLSSSSTNVIDSIAVHLSGRALSPVGVLSAQLEQYAGLVTKTGTTLSADSPFGSGIDGSIYFNGTSDFVNTNTSILIGNSDFTIEFWLKTPAFASNTVGKIVIEGRPDNVEGNYLTIAFAANTRRITIYSNNAIVGQDTSDFALNQWRHIAVTRNSGAINLYINGTRVDSRANTTNLLSMIFKIARASVPSTNWYQGLLSNLRVINGTALYTGATINVPAAPLISTTNTALLYQFPYPTAYKDSNCSMYLAGTYPISSFTSFDGSNSLVTYPLNWQLLKLSSPFSNNTQYFGLNLKTSDSNQLSLIALSTVNGIDYDRMAITNSSNLSGTLLKTGTTLSAASPFGNGVDGSIYFNGSVNDFITINKSITLGTNNFTIECWLYTPVLTGNTFGKYVLEGRPDLTNGNYFSIFFADNTRKLAVLLPNSNVAIRTVEDFPINQWTHIAYSKSSNIGRLYTNGNLVSSIADNSNYTSQNFRIARGSAESPTVKQSYEGYISNLRIINGEGIYTSSSITPPTSPLNLYLKGNGYTEFLYKSPYSTNYLYNLSTNDIHISSLLDGYNTQTITVTADTITLDDLAVHNKGVLTFPQSSTTLTVTKSAGLMVTSEGTLQIGTSSNPVPLSAVHTLNLRNLNVSNGGSLSLYGAYKPAYEYLKADAPSGSNDFLLNSSLSSFWLSGDDLAFIPNLTGSNTLHSLSLSGFSSGDRFRTITNSSALYNSISSNPYIPTVSNLTRNVLISGTSTTSEIGIYGSLDSNKINFNNSRIDSMDLLLECNNSNFITSISGNVFRNNTIDFCQRDFAYVTTGQPTNSYINSTFTTGSVFTGVFTMEWFAYNGFLICEMYHLQNNQSGWTIYGTAGGKVSWTNIAGTDTYIIQSNSNLPENRWNHIAFTRDSNNILRLYINGILDKSITLAGAIQSSNTGLFIGRQQQDSSLYYYNSIVSNLRFIKDQCLYSSSNFTIPTSRLTLTSQGAIPANVRFLSLTRKTLKDDSYYNNTITSNNIFIVDDHTPFNTTIPYRILNLNFSNNILTNSDLYALSLSNANLINCDITNNMLLSSHYSSTFNPTNNIRNKFTYVTEFNRISAYNTNIHSNYIVGGRNAGCYMYNVSSDSSSRIEVLSYKANLSGIVVAGSNDLTLSLSSVYSQRDGIHIDTSESNLNSLTFKNILANNNSTLGVKISGNSLNYLTPITLNINGLIANDNLSGGFEGYNISGNLSGLELNRNGLYGMKTSIGNAPTTIDGITALMNNVATASAGIGILSGYNYYQTLIKNANVGKAVGSSSFGSGIILDSTKFSQFVVTNSTVSGGASDFRLLATRNVLEGSYLISNTNIGNLPVGAGVTNSNYQADVLKTAGFAFTNMNNASGYNVTYLAAGTRQIDSTVNITAGTSPSERLTPQSTTLKLRSGSKFVALNSGDSTTVSVYVRKSTVASNGVAYNGSAPRLIMKRNPYMGRNSDIVMDQLDTTSENFLKLTGTIPAVTDSGVLEFYVDCDGTQGFINIDNWTAN